MEGKWHVSSMGKDSLIQRGKNLTYYYILPPCKRWTMNTEQLILMQLFSLSIMLAVLALNLVAQSYIPFSDHKASRQI